VSATFRSLRHRNARLFFVGLLVSNVGTWLQLTATALLVKRLAGPGEAGRWLGIATAAQFLPMLLLGAWAGAFADQRNRRRLTIVTQAALAVQALVLGAVDLAGLASIPLVLALGLCLGVINAIDNPARRGFVTELVEPRDISNAVSLNTAVMTGSRIFGPALAALLVSTIGTGWCFVFNGVSFAAILASLFLIDSRELYTTPVAPRGGRPVRDGLGFVRHHPVLFQTFVVLVIVSTFSFNYQVALPLLVEDRWGAADTWFGWLLTIVSVGSMLGSLMVAGKEEVTTRSLFAFTAVLGLFSTAVAFAPNLWFAAAFAVPLGIGGAGFVASANAITQQIAPPGMRSRILALTAVAFLGSTPIGGPVTGLIADAISAEWSLAYGGLVALGCAAAGAVWHQRSETPSPRRAPGWAP
jgi:MFS family permease